MRVHESQLASRPPSCAFKATLTVCLVRRADADFRQGPSGGDDRDFAEAEAFVLRPDALDAAVYGADARALFDLCRGGRVASQLDGACLAAATFRDSGGAASLLLVGALLTLLLRVGRALFGHLVLNLGVYLASDTNGRAREEEPEQEDDDRAERAVGRAVGVEEAEVRFEGERDEQLERDADDGAQIGRASCRERVEIS